MKAMKKSRGCGCITFHKRSISNYEDESTSSCRSSETEINKTNGHRKIKSEGGLFRFFFPRNFFKGWRRDDNLSMTKVERTMKAALLIQRWYRRYLARMEVRRRYTWTIFQSIEYAGEQDQMKLYNFFNALLTHIPESTTRPMSSTATSNSSSIDTLYTRFEDESDEGDDDEMQSVDRNDLGIHISFPMQRSDLDTLINAFRRKKHHRLHARYVAGILKESASHLKRLPNLNHASTAISKQITICGDLHGKMDDLLVVFHKNGLPSPENPYVFNGDFVDRGKKGLEVFLLLLSCMMIFPGGVFLNRGNHEDYIMNSRYGFVKEVQSKYKHNSEKLLKLIEGVYRWLPLGTIVNNKVLIVHGGISDTTDLDLIKSLDRGKYISLLRPPITDSTAPGAELIDKVEWKQVFDLLWSDPQPGDGCIPNGLRGAGTYYGPDVSKKFLKKNKMLYLIRSHECKPDGYELTHNNKVITIFSASNYYELGSNKGAYLKLVGPQLDTHFVQYTASTGKTKRLTFRQRIGLVESSAIRELRGHIISNRSLLELEFVKTDPQNTGYISINEWCKAMETATGLGLPWRMLRDKLVIVGADLQMVKYSSTFDRVIDSDITSVHGANTVVEALYRNKSSLEAIFRIIDKDNSGFISLEEFSDACHLIREHMSHPISHDQLLDMCKLMDMNKDGLVDLNEFLETFRMVDPEQNKDPKCIPYEFKPKTSKSPIINGLPENDKQLNKEIEIDTKDFESSMFGSPIHNSNSPQTDTLPFLSSPKMASTVNVTITNTFPLSPPSSPHIEVLHKNETN